MAQLFTIKLRSSGFFRGYIMREVLGDIRESQFRELKDQFEEMGITDEFKINETTMTIEHIVSGNMVISKGLKKSSGNQTAKVKSIKDPTDVWIEEADEIGNDDFVKVDTSIRTKKADKVQIWLTFNPENENSWINKMFFVNNKPRTDRDDCVIVHSTYEDNTQNLQDSYIKTLQTMLIESPDWAKVFVKGLWGGGLKGRVFTNFKKLDEWIEDDIAEFVGLDFGFTNDPTAAILMKKSNSSVYAKELIYQTGLTNPEIARKLINAGVTPDIEVFCDSAEPKSIEELRNYGINAKPAIKGPGSLNAGIDFVKTFTVFVMTTSQNIWKENKSYVWAQDKNGNFTNKPIDAWNHANDAIRYGLYSKYGGKKKQKTKLVIY